MHLVFGSFCVCLLFFFVSVCVVLCVCFLAFVVKENQCIFYLKY